MKARRWLARRWLTIFVGWVYLYLAAPLLVVVYFSFSDRSFFTFPPEGFSLVWYQRAWESGRFFEPAIWSIALACAATVLATLAAVPASLAVRRFRGSQMARIIELAVLAPLIIPTLILGIALLYFFSDVGLLDTPQGIIAGHTVLVLPFMFRSVLISVRSLDRRQEEASAVLGASAFTTFRRVVLPRLIPGILAGGIFSFIVSFDQFTLSLFIVRNEWVTLPVALYQYLYDVNDPVVAAVATALVLFAIVVTLVVQKLGWLDRFAGAAA